MVLGGSIGLPSLIPQTTIWLFQQPLHCYPHGGEKPHIVKKQPLAHLKILTIKIAMSVQTYHVLHWEVI